ncbi:MULTISPECIES: glycosyltransferase [Fervidobacterium]|uniref:Glycosyl transferase group 1 n=1 Tax=Fervidobacterium nodosum (strain ATCC 35602 / DSM 5306 / Rt17-B1) TaxID=381764 RepID=A7HK83_FERNB|nr:MULTISPECIES: glycosyltransferase [Fervidobacterium]ABS60316.1 glycosyl transferase group 1 [Fervidobacterium nodosum Rt17-B1]KAF2961412.1 glycosyl transferase family 1 [Fervidobacterium sp. 2310opik-2]PHJ13735.1 glycosyl transferase family 1 [Fervidobacterium sp. SC_NGM5_G05]HOJ93897.1 glycosyltransferase [Fervidobacterium nodosum]
MTVELPVKKLSDYSVFAKDDVEKIFEIGKKMKGLKVVHVNATAYGGGVAELLMTIVPLMRDAGVDASWEVLEAPMEFFNVTKKLHNTLQGADIEITDEEWALYEKVNEENAKKLNLDADVIIIHDPQPAYIPLYKSGNAHYIWRCHIDTSTPNLKVWNRLTSKMNMYKKALFHIMDYVREPFDKIAVEFPPSIDPLSPKNREMSKEELEKIAKTYNIDMTKPLITVVARFDPWKDLFSSIDVYRKVKEKFDVQLAIVSAMAKDDPEGWIFFEDVLRYAGTDKDILFLTDLKGVGHLEVNGIQRLSTIGLHTATREGFGLVISEMMWKQHPVVARPVGGVKIQIDDGINGYLRNDVNELSEAIVDLLSNKQILEKMGKNAKEKVRSTYLSTAHVKRYFEVIESVING